MKCCGGGIGDSFNVRRLWIYRSGNYPLSTRLRPGRRGSIRGRTRRGGGGGRSFNEDTGGAGAGADLASGTIPEEVVLVAMALVDPPTGCASIVLRGFSGDGSWLVSAAETQSLAFGDI